MPEWLRSLPLIDATEEEGVDEARDPEFDRA
jgi:hypothetical protein